MSRASLGIVTGLLVLLCGACTTPAKTLTAPRSNPIPISTSTVTAPVGSTPVSTLAPVRPTSVAASPFEPTSTSQVVLSFDDTDSKDILTAVYPNVALELNGDEYIVNRNQNWTVWVNSRAEGRFLRTETPELAAIIAEEKGATESEGEPWGSFLVIMEKRSKKLEIVARGFLFPSAISPRVFDVQIDSAVDFDHDGQAELLVTTEAIRNAISTRAGFLFEWNGGAFVEEWSAPLGVDNTGAINQADYFAAVSLVRLADLDGDGMDEITVDTTRIDYAPGSQGLADVDQEKSRRYQRQLFHWQSTSFALDPLLSTPLPPIPTKFP